MSRKANFFKLGLFVIGAIAAGVIVLTIIGTGKFLQKRVTIEPKSHAILVLKLKAFGVMNSHEAHCKQI